MAVAKTKKRAAKGKLSPGGKSRGLEAADVAISVDDPQISAVAELVRFAGGAYSSLLKKVDRFSDRTLAASLRDREGYASRLLHIDAQARKLIAALQAKGFKSPYLRNYVVARLNPVRFHKMKKGDTKPPMSIAEALTRMAAAVKNFRIDSVSNSDLAWVAVGAGAQD